MGVLIYSGNTWNGIWSHGHELAKNLAKHVETIYLSVPHCRDPAHPNLNKKADTPVTENLAVVGSPAVFEKFSLPYFLYTQLWTIFTFFKIKNRARVFFLYNPFDLPFFLLAKLFGKRVYFLYVDDYAALAKTFFFKRLAAIGTALFLNLSSGVFCTARILEETARKHNANVWRTPNCVNLADSAHLTSKTRTEFILGFVGALGHWVRTALILDIARAFKNDGDTRILIVGGGEGLAGLQEAKAQENLDNLELTGFVPHEKVYPLLSQFDIAFLPFYVNDITNALSPVKLFEYWLAEKPVVCIRTRELAPFEGTALCADTGEALIKELRRLKSDPARRKELAEKGHRLVKDKYNWDVMIKPYLEAL